MHPLDGLARMTEFAGNNLSYNLLAQCCGFPPFDVMHHHGQIAYIQTLLGDQEDHFQMG